MSLGGSLGISGAAELALGWPAVLSMGVNPAPPVRTFIVPASGSMNKQAIQTPEEILNYTFDWSVAAPGDPVVSSLWDSSPADLLLPAQSLNTSALTTVLTSGGSVGRLYFLRNEVVLQSGLELSATLRVLIVANNFL